MANEETKTIFAQKLRTLLKEHDMQQLDLAKQLGTGPATINDWVKGRSMPRPQTLRRLAEIFHYDMEALVSDAPLSVEAFKHGEGDLKAAFFGGYADDLSDEEIDELWNDARDYFAFRIEQRRKRKG